MFKKIFLLLAVVCSLSVSAQTLKVGLVDVNAVMSVLPATQAAQTKLQETQKKYETEYGALRDELAKQYEEIQNMKEDELPAIRERKMRAFADNQQKLQVFEEQIMQDMQKKQAELMNPILTDIRNAIESVGKENGYSLIQDNSQQVTLFYASPVEDVTPLVKAKLGVK